MIRIFMGSIVAVFVLVLAYFGVLGIQGQLGDTSLAENRMQGAFFLVAAAVTGAAWFALEFAWPIYRHGLRKRRGHCPLCAYDLRGDLDAGCPECGWNRAEGES